MNTSNIVASVVKLYGAELIYLTRAIISRGLYIFYPIFKDYFFVFKEVFQKIMSLCMACIQERIVSNQEWLLMARVWYNTWIEFGMSHQYTVLPQIVSALE